MEFNDLAERMQDSVITKKILKQDPSQVKKLKDELTAGFSESQLRAYDLVMQGKNLCITGAGGCGKTHLSRVVRQSLEKLGLNVGMAASTGVAAINAGGCTIHSFLGTGITNSIKDFMDQPYSLQKHMISKCEESVTRLDVLFIDEVSMISGDFLEFIDFIIKRSVYGDEFGETEMEPFGGIQVILVGDFLQLEPVNKDNKIKKLYAFEAEVFKSSVEVVELSEYFRQKDYDLIESLAYMRFGVCTPKAISLMNECARRNLNKPTKLVSTNKVADSINEYELSLLKGKLKKHEASFTGSDKERNKMARDCLAPTELKVKKGAPLLVLVNNASEGYFNGMRVTFDRFEDEFIMVKTSEGNIIGIKQHTWSNKKPKAGEDIDAEKLEFETIASMRQFPVKLAYAITIHKSQSLSIDNLEVDLSKIFARGQAYVALSRATSLEGLALAQTFDPSCIKVNSTVIEFYKSLQGAPA